VALGWSDRSFNELGFVVLRRTAADADFRDVATLPPDTTAYTDTIDLASVPVGSDVWYEVVADTPAGRTQPSNVIVMTPCFCAGATGLRERIWDDIDPVSHEGVGEPVVDQVDPVVNHAYGTDAPAPGVGPDTFAVEWVGEIVAEETKAYDISVVADDGIRLFLDGKPVIANGWREQTDTEYFAGPMPLTAGQRVKVRLQMYDQNGPATARLRWNGPGGTREAIPNAFLFQTVAAGDELAAVPVRPATAATAFALPATDTTPASVAVRWLDNAFGETGYEIQRATDAQFTQNVTTFAAATGSDLFLDTGPLEPATRYSYRVRPLNATAWTTAGSVQPGDPWEPGLDFNVPRFDDARAVTLNGYASTTAEGTLKLVPNQQDRIGSSFFNRAMAVDEPFQATFDIRISNSTGADGMAFVIQNAAAPDPRGGVPNQLRAMGRGNGGLGFGGLPHSVALTFDFYRDLDQLGVFTNGASPGDNPFATYDNAPDNWPLMPNGTIDLRAAPFSPEAGTGTVNLDGGVAWRVSLDYSDRGYDGNGTPDDSSDDTGLLTIEIRRADSAVSSAPLVRTQYAVDLADVVGGPLAVMGFTASTGIPNARQEVLRFRYSSIVDPPPPPRFGELYVRGDAWTAAFTSYLAAKGLGDANYGYRLLSNGAPVTGPAADPEQILPWINMNQLVLKYEGVPAGSGVPTPNTVVFASEQGVQYTAVAVTPVAGDPTAFLVTLNQPLGGGTPATGVAPSAQQNGDRVTVALAFPDFGGTTSAVRMNVLQGDVDHTGENGTHSVLAADYSAVRKKFFKTTADATNDDASYSPFHDVNGSGDILANDFSEVKKRFFQQMPPPPAAASPGGPPPFGTRRLRPASRDLLE
jgi:hypothetical protein